MGKQDKVTKLDEKREKKIEFKYEIFRPGASMFMAVWNEITGYKKYPPQLLLKIAKISRQFDKEHDIWQDAWKKLVEQYARKDDKGEIAPQVKEGKARPNTFEIPEESQAAWKKAVDELDAQTFVVTGNKLTLNGLVGCGVLLSPQEVLILGDILDENEEG